MLRGGLHAQQVVREMYLQVKWVLKKVGYDVGEKKGVLREDWLQQAWVKRGAGLRTQRVLQLQNAFNCGNQ